MVTNRSLLRRLLAAVLTVALSVALAAPAAHARSLARRRVHRAAFVHHRYRYSLGERVEGVLRADRSLAGARARATSRGTVVLSGTVFDDNAARQAELTASHVRGVRQVVNHLTTVTGQWMAQQVRINSALVKIGALQNVSARVVGDQAYLWGDVNSEADRAWAARVASSFSPNLRVVNLVRVVPGALVSLPSWL